MGDWGNGFHGLEDMERLLKQIQDLGKSIDAEAKEKALKAGAEVLKDKIENHPNTPKSSYNKEHAKDHIEIEMATDGTIDVGFAKNHFYMLFHEIGAEKGEYKTPEGKKYYTPKIPAKPFVRPSLENNSEEIQKAMAEVLRRELGL